MSTIITKQRSGAVYEMEKLLTTWMEDQIQRRVPLSLITIQEKARSLYADIKGKRQDVPQTFVASNGWCSRFKNRAGFHNVKVSGEAASGDAKAAQMFPDVLKEIINEGVRSEVLTAVSMQIAVFWVSLIALMMEAARTSETLVNFYQTTRCYNPEDSNLHQ
jgi:hypothetical protein